MDLAELLNKVSEVEESFKVATPKFFGDLKDTFSGLMEDAESAGDEFKKLVEETIGDAMEVADALSKGELEVGEAMEALTRYQASLENYADAAKLAVVSQIKDTLLKILFNVINVGCHLLAGGLK